MASFQCSLKACLGQKREFKPLSIVQNQLGNARHSINLVRKQLPNSIATFSLLSIDGDHQKHSNLYASKISSKEDHQWRVCCSNDGSCGIVPPIDPTLGMILEFSNAINVKDTQKLDQLLSNDCIFQDFIFYILLDGKESIINFLQNLMEAVGQNVRFVIDSGMDGDKELTTTVNWHLEWKGKEIPFTTGSSFFECQEVDGKLVISKITRGEEFPVKPGDWVLKLLEAMSTAFDSFPLAAEQLLTRSQGTHEGIIKLLEMLGAYKKN